MLCASGSCASSYARAKHAPTKTCSYSFTAVAHGSAPLLAMVIHVDRNTQIIVIVIVIVIIIIIIINKINK